MGEVDIGGIPTYHYEADSSVFSMSNPDNFCYCPKAILFVSIFNKFSRQHWRIETSILIQAAKCAKENILEDSWDLSTCQAGSALKAHSLLKMDLPSVEHIYGFLIIKTTTFIITIRISKDITPQPPNHPVTCKDGLFSTLGCQVSSLVAFAQTILFKSGSGGGENSRVEQQDIYPLGIPTRISSCQGAPAYGSAPHFLSGAPELSNATKGLLFHQE